MTQSSTPTLTAPSSTATGTFNVQRLQGKLVDVWPYHEPLYPNDTLSRLWNVMCEDNTLHRVFYEHNPMRFNDFMRFFDAKIFPQRLLLIYTTKDGEDAGFGWFDDVKQGIRAFANVCMRKKYWGPAAEEASTISLDYIFTAHDVASVYGLTPKPNRMALAQAKRLGFKVLAEVPGLAAWNNKPCDVTLTMLKREDFYGRRR